MPDVHWTAYPASFGGFVAAAAAVGIALWGARRERRSGPKLRLLYDGDSGQDFAVGVMDTQHWVRVRVENGRAGRSGRRSAHDVEVLVVAAARDDGSAVTQLEGCAFLWSNVLDADGHSVARLTIPPGVARRFDLLVVRQPLVSDGGGGQRPTTDDPADGARAELRVVPVPGDWSASLAAGRYTLDVVVTARDSDAAYYEIGVEFDGKWSSARSIRDHIKVAVVGRHRRPRG